MKYITYKLLASESLINLTKATCSDYFEPKDLLTALVYPNVKETYLDGDNEIDSGLTYADFFEIDGITPECEPDECKIKYGEDCTGDLCLASVGPLNCNQDDCNWWSEKKEHYSCDTKKENGSLLIKVDEDFDNHLEMLIK